MNEKPQQVELLPGANFVGDDGNVLPMADFRSDDMELTPRYATYPAVSVSRRGLKRAAAQRRRPSRRGGRSHSEISGQDIAMAIGDALRRARDAKGSDLTDEESDVVARQAEHLIRSGTR